MNIYELFKSVFGNIVLSNEIFKHARLFRRNENVQFYDLNELKKYKEIEYITSLVYGDNDNELEIGDLPRSGVLKILKLYCDKYVKGEIIPEGVEVLEYTFNTTYESSITTIPSTVHTITNCSIINNNDKKHTVQPNITSISFSKCVNISNDNSKGTGSIIIPNTIKHLKFNSFWRNQGIPLRIGDIPFGITSLELDRVVFGNHGILPESLTKLKCIYNINNLYKNFILPNSLIHLQIKCDIGMLSNVDYSKELFNFIPPNLETFIIGITGKIEPHSNLFKCKSIKNLTIDEYDYTDSKIIIMPNSLPPNVTNLKIELCGSILPNTIPSSVTNLCLLFSKDLTIGSISEDSLPNELKVLEIQGYNDLILSKINKLPESLTCLNLKQSLFTKTCLVNLISKLPNSITSLILPPSSINFELKLPNNKSFELTFNDNSKLK